MTVAENLLDSCRDRGIRLSVEDGRLLYDAPRGALDDALRPRLKAHKAEIMALLAEPDPRAAPPAPDPAPDSYPAILKDWLGALVADGSIGRHLGPEAEARARRLLEQDALDVLAARALIHAASARVWPGRYRATGVHHEPLDPD